MGSDFDSFAQSPLGEMFESALHARGAPAGTGSIFVIGSWGAWDGDTSLAATCVLYDPATSAWYPIDANGSPSITYNFPNHELFLIGSRLYSIRYYESNKYLSIQQFDPNRASSYGHSYGRFWSLAYRTSTDISDISDATEHAGTLVAVGGSQQLGGSNVRVAQFDGSAWSDLGFPSSYVPRKVTSDGTNIYVMNEPDYLGGPTFSWYDGSTWTHGAEHTGSPGFDSGVPIDFAAHNGQIWVAYDEDPLTGSGNSAGVATWNPTTDTVSLVQKVDRKNQIMRRIKSTGGRLFVLGRFTADAVSGGNPLYSIAEIVSGALSALDYGIEWVLSGTNISARLEDVHVQSNGTALVVGYNGNYAGNPASPFSGAKDAFAFSAAGTWGGIEGSAGITSTSSNDIARAVIDAGESSKLIYP